MARRRTILTPPPFKPDKPAKVTDQPGMSVTPGRRYRARPISPNIFEEIDPPTYSDDLAALRTLAADLLVEGVEVMLEQRAPGAYVPIEQVPVITAEMLGKAGLARSHGTHWRISPEGLRAIREGRLP